MSVLVIGSINVDLVTYSQRLPLPGESMLAERYELTLGGKGCNQAVASRRLGAATRLIGRIGGDGFAAFARNELARHDIDLALVQDDADAPTGLAVIGVDAEGQNAITVVPGANDALDATHLAGQDFAGTRVLLAQLETPVEPTRYLAGLARGVGATVILDPAPIPRWPLPADLWPLFDIVTPNEIETEMLTGIRPDNLDAAAAAAESLLERGVGMAVIKLGGRGTYARGRGLDLHIPAFPVTVRSTVAAGDCFSGGLAFGLSEGMGWAAALRFATACGALACTRAGAADSAPRRAEVEALISADAPAIHSRS